MSETGIVIDFEALGRTTLEAMAAAGAEVVDCHRVLAKTGDNIVGEILRDAGTFYEWNHYPDGDVFDPETNAQFYYHAHPAEDRGGEHGHFHTFLRPRGMPAGVRPAPVADLAPSAGENDALSHLVAISMDAHGLPIRLFTTNRWVTGETWYAAPDVIRMLDRFVVDLARPSWPVNRWITAMVRLFRPQIAALLEARDRRIAAWAALHPAENTFEDRRLEIAAGCEASVDAQIRRIEAARSATRRGTG